MNWTETLLDPIYDRLGVAATFAPSGEDGAVDLTVIDKTSGVTVSEHTLIEAPKPAAKVRAVELAEKGLQRSDLSDGRIEFNGSCWIITAARPLPTLGGEMDGEYLLILSAV